MLKFHSEFLKKSNRIKTCNQGSSVLISGWQKFLAADERRCQINKSASLPTDLLCSQHLSAVDYIFQLFYAILYGATFFEF